MICRKHCYFWRWHHLPVMFLAFLGLGFALAAVAIPSPRSPYVSAGAHANVMGWAWSDALGWISLNDQNPSSPAIPHGVNINLKTGEVNGFGMSEAGARVCFGASCRLAACAGRVPDAAAPYDKPYARLEAADGGQRSIHGWAKVCSLGALGWVSLHCADPSGAACAQHPYGVSLDIETLKLQGRMWGGNVALPGVGFIDFRWAYLAS